LVHANSDPSDDPTIAALDDDLDMDMLRLADEYVSSDPLDRFDGPTHRAFTISTTISVRTPATSTAKITVLISGMTPGRHYTISDAGADATIVGDGWYIGEYMEHRKANIVGFDETIAQKNGLPIVTAYCVVVIPDGTRVLLRAYEAVYNKGSAVSLLSEYQSRHHGCVVDSVSKCHKLNESAFGTQSFQPTDNIVIPFDLRGCLMAFEHNLPTRKDMESLIPIDITSPEPWDPRKHYES
jgi:hypothetical protein